MRLSPSVLGLASTHRDNETESFSSGFGFKSFLKETIKRSVHDVAESQGIYFPHEEAGDGHMKNRSLPLLTLIEISKQKIGKEDIDVEKLRPTMFDMFGDNAIPKVKKFMKVIFSKLQHGESAGGGSSGGFMSLVGNLG